MIYPKLIDTNKNPSNLLGYWDFLIFNQCGFSTFISLPQNRHLGCLPYRFD